MEGPSHVGFLLPSAVCVTSMLSTIFPRPLSNDWEYIVHATGHPYLYSSLISAWMLFWHDPLQVLAQIDPATLLHKATLYALLIASASLPDHWERREPGKGNDNEEEEEPDFLEQIADETMREVRSHRGFTHSVMMLVLVVSLFGLVYVVGMRYLRLEHLVVDTWLLEEACVVFLALFLALFFHILADMMTKKGVSVLWPTKKRRWILPKRWRFRNNSWREHAVVWGAIAITAILFAKGIVGV